MIRPFLLQPELRLRDALKSRLKTTPKINRTCLFAFLLTALSLYPARLRADVNCADTPLSFLPGTDGRPGVEGDYLVIVYDAKSRQTYWYD
jgi:hypothetical protein